MSSIPSPLRIYCLPILLGVCFSMQMNSPARAQESDLEAVLKCDEIEEPADRLKCFDTVVEALKQKGVQAGSDVASAQEQPSETPPPVQQPTPEELFGDPPPPPKPRRPARAEAREAAPVEPEKPERLNEITSGVRRFWKNNDGDYVIVLENGQIWQALDASRLSIPDDPVEATVKRALFGGYRMVVRNKNRRGFSGKVKRIR